MVKWVRFSVVVDIVVDIFEVVVVFEFSVVTILMKVSGRTMCR